MARLNVNPTRMEMQTLKKRLQTARKGHRLLKNKSDEMVRQFMSLIGLNKELRAQVEDALTVALKLFIVSEGKANVQEIAEALSVPSVSYNITTGLTSIMGLNVPKIELDISKPDQVLPYSLISGNIRLDQSIITISTLFEKIIKLAEVEKTCDMLAEEIQKNKRRINALEYILIPQIEETIKYIVMKLDENERNNLVRLMKVKEKMFDV